MLLIIPSALKHTVWLVPRKNTDSATAPCPEKNQVIRKRAEKMNFTTDTMKEQDLEESKARWFWVGLIVAFLGLQLVINVVAVYFANSQPNDTIVQDYYQKGINWDRDHQDK